jgi:MFS-type transporter involved in bile tolerance (Atg22 family)
VGKSTAWIGPIISGIIIDRTGDTWKGFPFLLAITIVGFGMICYVNLKKGKEQCEAWVLSDPTPCVVNGEPQD